MTPSEALMAGNVRFSQLAGGGGDAPGVPQQPAAEGEAAPGDGGSAAAAGA